MRDGGWRQEKEAGTTVLGLGGLLSGVGRFGIRGNKYALNEISNNNCMSTSLTFTDLSFEIRFTQMALTYIDSYEKEVETRLFYYHMW